MVKLGQAIYVERVWGHGIQTLHVFKLVMLGKQGSRLLTNQDIIVFKVFKVKYFTHGSFLDAELGGNLSFVCHNIYASQVILRQGIKRKLGDNREINIWKNPWLNSSSNPYIQFIPQEGNEHLVVANIIDHDMQCWNINVLPYFFSNEDIQAIESVPLLNLHDSDQLSWKFTPRGSYSVVTTYHYVVKDILNTTHLKVDGNWKAIWNLKVPPKLKHML